MATFSQVEVENACEVIASLLGYSTLREHQIRVMSSFVTGSNVFGVLPTEGMGRVCATLYYQWRTCCTVCYL